jgi:hypothetical protein
MCPTNYRPTVSSDVTRHCAPIGRAAQGSVSWIGSLGFVSDLAGDWTDLPLYLRSEK